MIEDLSKTIKAQLYERVSSPLLASFTLSWAAWNYKFVVIILSSMTAPEKLQYIDKHIFPSIVEALLSGCLYPLLTALFLIFLYPIPAKYVYEHWRKKQRELKEIQQRIDDETPLTKEEARKIRLEAIKATSELELELTRRSDELARQKELIADLNEQLAAHQKPMESFPDTVNGVPLEESQLRMLQQIASATLPPAPNELIGPGEERIRTEYDLGELRRRGLVETSYSEEWGKTITTPTHDGRAYLLNRVNPRAKAAVLLT